MEAYVNLISDTVTKPDKKMIDFMLNADVGDDVFKEDPTVNKLESMLCDLFGKESALYFPLWDNGKSNGYKNSYPARRSINL